MSEECNVKSEIISRLLEHCQRPTSMLFDCLEVDRDVWCCPHDSSEAVRVLLKAFGEDEVVASGVVIRNGDSFNLSPSLRAEYANFVVLRNPETGEPFDIFATDGCLASSALAVLQLLEDGHTRRCLEMSDGSIFAAFSIEDVIVLRSCGLPVTLASELDQIPLQCLDQFCSEFGLSREVSDREFERNAAEKDEGHESESHPNDPFGQVPSEATTDDRVQPVELVLVGWSPSTLTSTEPNQIAMVVEHFKKLERLFRVNVNDVRLWQPSAEDFERWHYVADEKCADMLVSDIQDSSFELHESILSYGQEKPRAIQAPTDYATSLARLQQAAAGDVRLHVGGPDQPKRALLDCQRLMNEQVIHPLRELALNTASPVGRTMLLGIAELSHVFHTQSMLIPDKLNRTIAERGLDQIDPISEEQLKGLLTVADRLVDVLKTTNQCTQPKSTNHRNERVTQRLPHSA